MEPATTGTDEWDVPLGGLTGMRRVRLERTQIEAATAEARFLSNKQSLPEHTAAEIWEDLGGSDAHPHFEATEQVVWTVPVAPPGAPAASQSQHGWMLSTADRASAITLLPATVIVQTRAYERYSASLGEPLARVLELFTRATGAMRVSRLGLRYVNRLTHADAHDPTYWAEHIREPFAGALHGPTAALVAGALQQIVLKLGDTAGARIQSGVFDDPTPPAQRYSFLVDLDVYREQTQTFDSLTCANQTRQLNRTALALFTEVLSAQYLSDLGPTEIPPNDQPAWPQREGESS